MKSIAGSKKRKRIVLIVSTLAMLLCLGAGGYAVMAHYQRKTGQTVAPTASNSPLTTSNNQAKEVRIRVAAMGDMLAHDTITSNAKTQSGYDYGQFFKKITPLYSAADVVFCNQEGLSAGEAFGISGYPAFNAPVQFAKDLQSSARCNMINLANNHMGDKGPAATAKTVETWESLKPLAYAGANRSAEEQRTVRYATVKGVKIAFLAFADFNNNTSTPPYSVNLYHDQTLVRALVTEARSNSDVVIVSMHWGAEDSASLNTDQATQTTLLASLGVDVVIGTGPHVLQPMQTVQRPDGKPMTVWYSLGNMLSSQLAVPQLFSGVAQFDIVKDANDPKKITVQNLTFTPTYMHYEWTAEEQANNQLQARRNVMIYPLSEASEPLAKSRLPTTVQQQKDYIQRTLGKEVTVQ